MNKAIFQQDLINGTLMHESKILLKDHATQNDLKNLFSFHKHHGDTFIGKDKTSFVIKTPTTSGYPTARRFSLEKNSSFGIPRARL